MKLRRMVFAALSVCIAMTALVAPQTARAHVFICNEGTIDLWVMGFESYFGELLPGRWWMDGWYQVEPDDCQNINTRSDATVNFVVGLVKPNREFGIVTYSSRRAVSGVPDSFDAFCVSDKNVWEDGWGTSPYLPPCPPGFVAAPVSGSAYIRGGASLELTISPTPADYENFQVVVRPADGSEDAAAPPATTYEPPPRQPGLLEMLGNAVNDTMAKRSGLAASCSRAGAAWPASERGDYCGCMVDAVLDSLDDYGIADVVANWTQANLDALYGKGFYADGVRGCPPMPVAPVSSSELRYPVPGAANTAWFVLVSRVDSNHDVDLTYPTEEGALRVASTLTGRWNTQVVGPFDSGGYRIDVGPFDDEASAEQVRLQLVSMGYPQSKLVIGFR